MYSSIITLPSSLLLATVRAMDIEDNARELEDYGWEEELAMLEDDEEDKRSLGWHPGTCCNSSGANEWALIDGKWVQIKDGECYGLPWSFHDCDGMTCGGGFYLVYTYFAEYATCSTPCFDDATGGPRRWTPPDTPTTPDSPGDRGGPATGPPGYTFGPCCNGKPPKQERGRSLLAVTSEDEDCTESTTTPMASTTVVTSMTSTTVAATTEASTPLVSTSATPVESTALTNTNYWT